MSTFPSDSLTPLTFAISVVERLQQAGHHAVFAGGCVRDMLLARAGRSDPDDYDVATDATPQRVRKLFGKRQTLAVGESFGVIIVLGPKIDGRHLQVEVATFRAEGEYSDGRRPDNVVFCTAEEDAARRDFTINGMFYDPLSDRVLDYVGGQDDLQAGVLRAIGDPHARIAEDKLRMLRAVRFTARFDFAMEEATRAAVEQHAAEITVVSWERITQELTKVLTHRSRRDGIGLLKETGLLFQVYPELEPATESDRQRLETQLRGLELLDRPRFETALAVLLWAGPFASEADASSAISRITRRMKLSNAQREMVAWLTSHRGELRAFEERSLAERKTVLANDHAASLTELERAEAQAADASADSIEQAERYLRATPRDVLDPVPLVTGEDLIALGMTPGARFKVLLNHVRQLQLNEEISTRDEAMEAVRSRIATSED